MPDSVLGRTVIEQAGAALSVASLRQRVVAHNIAQRDAAGAQRLTLRTAAVAFDREMARAELAHAAAPAPPRTEVGVDRRAGAVSLEQDLLSMASNAGHYHAITRSLSRYFALLATVAGAGRS